VIEKARQFFGLEADELAISGFEAGRVYGLAARTVIVAVPKNRRSSAQQPQGDSPRRDEGGRGSSGRGRERSRGRDRDRDGNRSGNRGGSRQSTGRRQDRPEPRRSEGRDRTPEPEVELSDEPSIGTAAGEIGEIGEFALGVMERMNLGPFQIAESDDDGLIVLQVSGPAARVLAEGEGRGIDAIQLLANQVSVRINPDRQRVVVDVEGGAEAREDFLTKLADRVAKRALQTGRAVALDPMNSRDRRLIHVALRDRDNVATMSEGAGRYRQVVVVPEGADEFEEALEQSEQIGNA
jgi:spoIIIJ-associated protein